MMFRAFLFYCVLVVLSCWPGCAPAPVTEAPEPIDQPDTALALQHRLDKALDSLRARDTFPDIRPPRPQ